MNIDLKQLSVVLGVFAALSTGVGGYAVMQYQVSELQKAVTQLEAAKKAEDVAVVKRIDGLKCYVAKLHNQTLPECL